MSAYLMRKKLKKALSGKKWDEAAAIAVAVINDTLPAPPRDIVKSLESCAVHSDFARASMATLYLTGVVEEPFRNAAGTMLEEVARSADRFVSSFALTILGDMHVSNGEFEAGRLKLAEAHAKGGSAASLSLARLFANGELGSDPERCKEYLLAAVADEAEGAEVFLAELMISGFLKVTGHDPETILVRAAMHGDEHAAELLGMLEESRTQKRLEPIKPTSLKRPKLVRDAIMREFGATAEHSSNVAAALSGYPFWQDMERAVADLRIPVGATDEQCHAAEYNERRRIQAAVVGEMLDIEEDYIREAVIEHLKPTSGIGKPSLRHLERDVATRLFPVGARQVELGMKAMLADLGIEGDPAQLLSWARTRWPIVPEPFIACMQDDFGWKLKHTKPFASGEGSKIAVAIGAKGAEFDVYMSSVCYHPGDIGDEHVDGLMRKISATGRNAVLLFCRPLVCFSRGRDFSVLYGGRATAGQQWWDFVFRPGPGVDDVMAQQGGFNGMPTDGFIRDYAFDDALDICCELNAAAAGRDASGEPEEVTFIRGATGWSAPVFGDTGSMLRSFASSR